MKPSERIKTRYSDFVQHEIDIDEVAEILYNKHGWSLNPKRYEEFEQSDYYKHPKNEYEYADQMNKSGFIEEVDENNNNNMKKRFKDFVRETKENGVEVDIPMELEYKLRTLPEGSELTVDEFLQECGVDPKYMTGFGWASILKNAQIYKDMSDEEFMEKYEQYKKFKEAWNQSKEAGYPGLIRLTKEEE